MWEILYSTVKKPTVCLHGETGNVALRAEYLRLLF